MNYRSHAFAALLTHGVNEGFRAGRFDPAAPNCDPSIPESSVLFDAPLGGVPIQVWIRDWRFDEAFVAVAAWPTADVARWIKAGRLAKNLAGEVVASGWMGRGSRLRVLDPLHPFIFIRANRIAAMRSLPVPSEAADPLGLSAIPLICRRRLGASGLSVQRPPLPPVSCRFICRLS